HRKTPGDLPAIHGRKLCRSTRNRLHQSTWRYQWRHVHLCSSQTSRMVRPGPGNLIRLCNAFLLRRLARKHPQIARIPLLADLPPQHGSFDGAAVFVRMRAIRVSTKRHKRPKLRKKPLDLLRQDVPELELANTRSIDYPAAEVELQKLGRGGGVPALLVGLAHLAYGQAKAGLDGVEQR